MKVALIESPLVWENPSLNRAFFTEQIRGLADVDLVILPEMFTTGFSMSPEPIAEDMQGETLRWMLDVAKGKQCAMTGSIVIRESGKYYNRLLFVKPTGEVVHYDKRHLFSLAGEDRQYTPGEKHVTVEYKGFRIRPLICYDLRFPVFARNNDDYDLLIFVANWPAARIYAWDTLLRARAIENVCYVAGVNRTGEDANGIHYPGHSAVLDYAGSAVESSAVCGSAKVFELKKSKLAKWRSQFAFLNDRDRFTIL